MQVGAPAAQTVRSAPAAADVASSRQAVSSSVWRTSGNTTSTLQSSAARIRADTRQLSKRTSSGDCSGRGDRRAKVKSNHGAGLGGTGCGSRLKRIEGRRRSLITTFSQPVPASRRTAAVRPHHSDIASAGHCSGGAITSLTNNYKTEPSPPPATSSADETATKARFSQSVAPGRDDLPPHPLHGSNDGRPPPASANRLRSCFRRWLPLTIARETASDSGAQRAAKCRQLESFLIQQKVCHGTCAAKARRKCLRRGKGQVRVLRYIGAALFRSEARAHRAVSALFVAGACGAVLCVQYIAPHQAAGAT